MRRELLRWTRLPLLLAFLLASLLLPTAASAATSGSISGTVTSATTKAGVEGVSVCAYGEGETRCSTTGGSGSYTIPEVVAGTYTVSYEPQSGSNLLPQYFQDKASSSEAQAVVVAAGQTTAGVDAALHEGGRISGLIADAASKAGIPGIEVCALDSYGYSHGCTTSVSGGAYTIADLPSGSYDVAFLQAYESTLDYAPQFYNGTTTLSKATSVTVTAGATTSSINAELKPGGQVSGQITDAATKSNVAGIWVCVNSDMTLQTRTTHPQCALTNSDGTYVVGGLATGDYAVSFAPPYQSTLNYLPQNYDHAVAVVAGETTPAINAALQPGAQITGRVTDESTKGPLEAVEVCAFSNTGSSCAKTNASGEYTTDRLPTGEYTVEFLASGRDFVTQIYRQKHGVSGADLVPATAGSTVSGIDAALQPGGQITGTVTSAGGNEPLANTSVCAIPENTGNFGECAQTNASGEYDIQRLAAEKYTVSFYPQYGTNYLEQFYHDKANRSEAETVSVASAKTTPGINAGLHAGGQVTGTITDATTKAPLGGIVTCASTSGNEESFGGRCATSKSNGEYRMVGLATSDYTVKFEGAGLNYLTQYFSGKNSFGEAQHVKITAGSATPSIDATMHPGAKITGKVVDASTKQPLPYVSVTVYQSGVRQASYANTNANGEYVAVGLATGRYQVGFATIGYAEQYYKGEATLAAADPVAATVESTTTHVDAELVTSLPVAEQPPTIEGTAQQGQTLTEVHGVWTSNPTGYAYQWLQCNSLGIGCLRIEGATKQTYVPTGEDVGHTLKVEETAKNAGGTGEAATSKLTAEVLPLPPKNLAAPQIVGHAQQGQTLTEQHGAWENASTGYAYQWLQCNTAGGECKAIAKATGQTYVPSEGDVGHTLKVSEAARNAGGESSPQLSEPSGVVVGPSPVSTAPPTVSGTVRQGQILTEQHGAWKYAPTSYAYQWQRCNSAGAECGPISGGTGQSYELTGADVGHAMRVAESATNEGGTSGPVLSSQTPTVVPAPPASQSPPDIMGTAQQGQSLTATNGSWSNEPTKFAYQWLRCTSAGDQCGAISKATAQTYALTASDVGRRLEVEVTASNASGPSAPATSEPTAVIAPLAPVNTAAPAITGTTRQGQTLTAGSGAWENEPTSFNYQWLQCDSLGGSCIPIGGATEAIYTLGSGDVEHTLEVQVVAANAGGSSEPATSAATSAVSATVPSNNTPPTIAGTAQKGQPLAETSGTWTGEPTGYAEQWLRCDAAGGNCSPIAGALAQTYVLGASDVGHTLRVREEAINAGGTSAPATSDATAVVTPVPLQAYAGEDVSATAGTGVTLDGSGSSPAAEITKYGWDFGDGATGEGQSVTHSYAAAGTYTAKLTVSRGSESASDELKVAVAPAPSHDVSVTVVDSGKAAISGADVLYVASDGTRAQATTNGEGVAMLAGLPDGPDTVYAYKSGYQPEVGHVAVSAGGGQETISLPSGEVTASTLKSHEMNLSEIEAAGIDTSNPANQNVYEFEVRLAFIESPGEPPVILHGFVNKEGHYVGKTEYVTGPGTPCGLTECRYEDGSQPIVGVPSIVEGHPLIQWLILRGKAAVLKQFFTVSMVVQDLSPEPFKLTGGSASLSLPAGMSLAPTSSPQALTQSVPDIPGGGSATTNWVVRGDAPGNYYLSAQYNAKLQPFNADVATEAALAQPLHVWGVEALSLSVQADEGFLAEGVPYHVKVGVTNKADVPLYNVTAGIDSTLHERFIFQPDQPFSSTIAELKPGETIYAPEDILVPDVASQSAFNPALSSAHFDGEAIHPGVGIEAVKPPPLYTMKATREAGGVVHLHWQPVPGAEGYEVFSTPSLDTPFAEAPDSVFAAGAGGTPVTRLPPGASDAYVRDGSGSEPLFYAVTTILGGTPTLSSAAAKATEAEAAGGPVGGPLTAGELRAGGDNPSVFCVKCFMGKLISFVLPVDGPTGNFWHTFTDLGVSGRGPNLNLTRTYNSSAAGVNGPFGYGWSFAYDMSLGAADPTHVVVTQENGAQVTFTEQSGGSYAAPPRVTATLTHNSDGSWSFVRRKQETFGFNAAGQLTAESDRNGYTTSLTYVKSGQLSRVTDAGGRSLAFGWQKGHITSIRDPIGREVRYSYDSVGDLTNVTDVAGGNTHFTYDSSHRVLSMRLPNQAAGVPGSSEAAVTNVYDSQGRVTSQIDQLGRKTTFAYSGEPLGEAGGTTTITNPKGNVTSQHYQYGLLLSATEGVGTADAATWQFEYDVATLGMTGATDPNGHTTRSTFDAEGNVLSTEDALGRKTTNTYDSHNDPLTTIDPMGVTTTMTYDGRGNRTSESRPLSGTSRTQTITYAYSDAAHPGDLTTKTDPTGRRWTYAYDKYGDVASSTDPLYEKTTSTYNKDGWKLTAVSPRGNISGGSPSAFTTSYAYDSFGQVVKTTDPLGRTTTKEYDADQNLVASTDPNGHATYYSYDAADEQTAVHRADRTTTRTTYWPDGTVKKQIDAAGHSTRYDYDALGRRTTTTDPLGRSTHFGYDAAGNQTSITDPTGQVTTKTYDAANEVTAISYGDGKTPNVSGITYDGDGERTAVSDSTGKWTWSWDSLHRLESVVEGASGTVSYVYDLRNLPTQIIYPNGKSVIRTYDGAGRLTSVHDWHASVAAFKYDADSNIIRQEAARVTDAFTFNNADEMMSVADRKGTTTLFSAQYARDANGQLASDTSAPAAANGYGYTALNQLCYAGSASGQPCGSPPPSAKTYRYDEASNLTQREGTTQAFDAANQLCWSSATPGSPGCDVAPSGATSYGYDSRGNRISVTPAAGPVSHLSYDQANRLTAYAAGATKATYAYNGEGLRMSKAVGKGTTTFAWDVADELPLLLEEGKTSLVYGPGGLPLEQIKGNTTLWLHHDQLGSTRALTNATGSVEGTYTYSPWGQVVSHTGSATTSFQFAGQYTDAETGHQYLISRYYDSSTGNFLTRDPAAALTLTPYSYVGNDPLDMTDPTGLFGWDSISHALQNVSFGVSAATIAIGAGVAATGVGAPLGGAIILGGTVVSDVADGAVAAIDCRHITSGISPTCLASGGTFGLDIFTLGISKKLKLIEKGSTLGKPLLRRYDAISGAAIGEVQLLYGELASRCASGA